MRARWLGMAGIVACATWSTPAGTVGAQARPERQEIRRPAGWNAATHGENGRPDYPASVRHGHRARTAYRHRRRTASARCRTTWGVAGDAVVSAGLARAWCRRSRCVRGGRAWRWRRARLRGARYPWWVKPGSSSSRSSPKGMDGRVFRESGQRVALGERHRRAGCTRARPGGRCRAYRQAVGDLVVGLPGAAPRRASAVRSP